MIQEVLKSNISLRSESQEKIEYLYEQLFQAQDHNEKLQAELDEIKVKGMSKMEQ